MSVIEILVSALLILLGASLGVLAWRASRAGRRLLRDRARKVRELDPGPAKLTGELRATEPLTALDGSRAVAVRGSLRCVDKSDAEDFRSLDVPYTGCSPVEVVDETGTCALEVGPMLILGPTRSHVFEGKDFEARHPALWSGVLGLPAGAKVEQVFAEEIVVPDGVTGIASGKASLAEGLPRRFKLGGDEGSPLVLSCWDEKTVLRVLLMPAVRVAWLALLSLLVAGLALAIPLFVEARWGL